MVRSPCCRGSAGIVLLISCLNLANMMLAHGVARSREIAIRQAIGGGRGRLVRQLLTEGLVLALAGGLAGLGAAYLGSTVLMGSLVRVMPIRIALDPTPDVRVVAATAAFAGARHPRVWSVAGAAVVADRHRPRPERSDRRPRRHAPLVQHRATC